MTGALSLSRLALPKDLAAASIREAVLSNGLRVLVIPRGNLPTCAVMAWIRAGAADERPADAGLSHFLEHLLFRGSPRFGPGVLDRITYREGGENNAFTGVDTTSTLFHLPSPAWRIALAMEADRIRRLLLRPRDVEVERRVVLEEIRGSLDDPWDALTQRMERAAFRGHPYARGVLGTLRTIRRVPRSAIARFHRERYVAQRVLVVVAGDVEPDAVLEEARARFASLPGRRPPDAAARRPCRPPAPARIVLREPEGRIARVRLSFPGPALGDPAFLPALVLAQAAGYGRASRLWRALVERRRLAASAGASLDARLSGGAFVASAEARLGIPPARLERGLVEVLADLGRTGPTRPELARAKQGLLVQHLSSLESLPETASDAGYFWSLRQPRLLVGFPVALRRVTPAEVRGAARAFLRPRARVTGWSIPRGDGRAAAGPARVSRGSREDPFAALPTARPPRPRGAARPGRLAGLRREILGNGLVALVLPVPSLPLVSLHASLDADARFEPAGFEGLSLLAGRLLEEGTRRLGSAGIARIVEDAGASLESGPAGVFSRWGRADLRAGIDLTAEILRRPAFRDAAFRREKERLLQEMEGDEEDPRMVAHDGIRRLVYGPHFLGRSPRGTRQSLARIGREAVVAFHRRIYGPSRAVVAAVGDLDPEQALAAIRRAFGDWAPCRLPRLRGVPIVRRPGGRIEARDMERYQCHVYLGHLGIRRLHPDWLPMVLLDPILGSGAGFTDRVSRRLREQLGLAYNVYASATEGGGTTPGMIVSYLGCEPGNVARAAREMDRVIRRLVEEGVTRKEFEEARSHVAKGHVFGYETHAQWAGYLVFAERQGLPFDACRTFPGRIRRVTRRRLHEAIRRRIRPADLCLSAAGPGAAKVDWGRALGIG